MTVFNPKQYVELFHLLFLNQLGRKLDKKLYALKGGCNMRFYFNSIRYSEDMDIDIQTIHKDTLYKNVNQILTSVPFKCILQNNNLKILSISAPKQTLTTQCWKILLRIKGKLFSLHTKIEFSRRTFGKDVAFELINPTILNQYALLPILANHYSIQTMYQQKILALALRKETQARDVFDLYLLIGSMNNLILNDKETRKKLSIAINNAKNITFADFKGQVIAYLSEGYQKQYENKKVWENIVEVVMKKLANENENI